MSAANDIKVLLSLSGSSAVIHGFHSIQESATELIKTLAAPVIGFFTVESLIELTEHSIETADQMGKMAQRAGLAVEALSSLSLSVKFGDASVAQLSLGLKTLSKRMVETGQGSGDVLVELMRIADQFRAMDDGANKTALAIDKFGKTGQNLIPWLNRGSAAIKEQMELAQRLGLVIGKEFAEEAEKFNESGMKMKATIEGAFLRLAERILPALNAEMERLQGLMEHTLSEKNISKAGDNLMAVTTVGGALTKAAFDSLDHLIEEGGKGWMRGLFALATVQNSIYGGMLNELHKLNEEAKPSNSPGLPNPNDKEKEVAYLSRRETLLVHIAEAEHNIKMISGDSSLSRIEAADKLIGAYALEKEAIEEQRAALAVNFAEVKKDEDGKFVMGMDYAARLKEEWKLKAAIAELDEKSLKAERAIVAEKVKEIAYEGHVLATKLALLNDPNNPVGPGTRAAQEQLAVDIARNASEQRMEALKAEHLGAVELDRRRLVEEKLMAATEVAIHRAALKQRLADQVSMANGVSGILGNMEIVAKAFGRKGFLIWKGIAIAKATIDAYSSAVAVFSSAGDIPYIGWILAPIAAASAVAAGLANVAQIAATQPQGFAAGGIPPIGRASLVGERGPELFIPRTAGMVVPADITASMTGGRRGPLEPAGFAGDGTSVAFFDDRSKMEEWLRSRPGRKTIVDIAGQSRREFV